MKASALQQGHTVFCKTLRGASHSDGFQGSAEVAQHRRNTIIGEVPVCNPPCCPPLHHFYLVYIFLGIRAPHGGGIFNTVEAYSLSYMRNRIL